VKISSGERWLNSGSTATATGADKIPSQLRGGKTFLTRGRIYLCIGVAAVGTLGCELRRRGWPVISKTKTTMREFDQGFFEITITQRAKAERHGSSRKSSRYAGKCPDGSLDTERGENQISTQ
jgi:hypothetical protein